MSLRDYVIASKTIPLRGDNKLSIRGLGFDDIQHLLVNRHGLIGTALKLFGDTGIDADHADEEQVRSFASSLLMELPELVAEVIALAADEPDLADKAKRLPAPVQLDALLSVYELTFSEPDSVKNFFDRLSDLMSAVPRPKAVEQLSGRAGSNGSGATLAS
jgi:hypothetical protein